MKATTDAFPARPCLRRARRLVGRAFLAAVLGLLVGSSGPPVLLADQGAGDEGRGPKNPDELRIVDCLLPGQVRKMGRSMTYVTQRRPVKTTALECQIRGGEYVAHDRANYATALRVWMASAQEGDPKAQYYVGEIYEQGLGTEPDYENAAHWYRKAAEKGYSPAQINLGFLYEQGLGVEQDRQKAMAWYRKASNLSGKIMLEGELEAIREKIAKANEQLEQARSAAETLRTQLEETRKELKDEKTEAQSSQERKEELERRVAKLSGELERSRSQIEALEQTKTQYELPPPSIEVFDPTATRGVSRPQTEPEATKTETTELAGRIEAPAGLESFLVNGESRSVDEDGFFRVSVDRAGRYELVAIDAMGQREAVTREIERTTRQRESEPAEQWERDVAEVDVPPELGSYHALVIGNDNYESMPDLKTASADARSMAELLETQYGFETTVLIDATLFDILAALKSLREDLSKDANVLVYYAGHGELDEQTGMGFWLPVDAGPDDRNDWISSAEISDQLDLLPARHVLVVVDSCYSGALTQTALPYYSGTSEEERERWLEQIAKNRSRTALTSGGLKPVLDTMGGDHSIFARAILETLRENDSALETRRLWAAVKTRVEYQTRKLGRHQRPQYAPIRHAGHESGDFVFVPRG
jgi:uncharacterized caspase-like protein